MCKGISVGKNLKYSDFSILHWLITGSLTHFWVFQLSVIFINFVPEKTETAKCKVITKRHLFHQTG